MSLTIVAGLPGSGKSLFQIQHGLEMVNRHRINLVSNIPLDFPALRRYCGMAGLGWVAHLIDSDKVIVIPGMNNISQIFSHRNALVLLDEAGVFFPARSFASIDKAVLVDLAQMRKGGVSILAACQYFEQIDKAFRMLASRVVHAQGLSQYSKELKGPKLLAKNYYYFDPNTYETWLADKKARKASLPGFIRTRLQYAQKCETKPIKNIDLQAFKIFRSFDRLEKAIAYRNPYYQEPFYEVNHVLPSSPYQTFIAAADCGGSGANAACAESGVADGSLFNF